MLKKFSHHIGFTVWLFLLILRCMAWPVVMLFVWPFARWEPIYNEWRVNINLPYWYEPDDCEYLELVLYGIGMCVYYVCVGVAAWIAYRISLYNVVLGLLLVLGVPLLIGTIYLLYRCYCIYTEDKNEDQ